MEEVQAQIARLLQENQALNQRLEALAAQQAQQAQQAQLAPDLLQRLATLPDQLANVMRNPQASRSLVDNRGLGKPPLFTNKEVDFRTWSRKAENYVCAVYADAADLLAMAAERETPVVVADVQLEFDRIADGLVDEINHQVYHC